MYHPIIYTKIMLLFSKICYKINPERISGKKYSTQQEIARLRNHGGSELSMALEGISSIAFKHRYTPATAAPEVYYIPPPSTRAPPLQGKLVVMAVFYAWCFVVRQMYSLRD